MHVLSFWGKYFNHVNFDFICIQNCSYCVNTGLSSVCFQHHCKYLSTDFLIYVKYRYTNIEIVFKSQQVLCKFCVHFTNTWIIWYYLNMIVPVCWNVTMLIQRSSMKLQYSNVNVDIILETNHSWIFMVPLKYFV